MCAALLVAGCSDDGGSGDASETGDTGDTGGEEMIELEVEEGCNPLVGASCALPYPNMTQVEEADTPTGYQLAFTPDTLGFAGPDRGDRPALADYLNRADGFSVGTGIVAQLGDQAPDWTLLPAWNSVESSLQPDSAVQIFDLDTGERVPCWGEVDLRTSDVERRAIMVRQAQALEPGHRHLVVITDTLKAEDGADMEPWPAFRALRDEVPTNADVVEGMRPRYEELFTFLDGQGVARENTLLAWEFVTFSDEFAVGQTKPLIDRSLEALDEPSVLECDGCGELLSFEVTSCRTSDPADPVVDCVYDDTLHPTVWREVFGRYIVPSFLDGSGRIDFGGDGNPAYQGTREAEFVMHVPTSLRTASAGASPTVVFGHGLLVNPEFYLANDLDSTGVMTLLDNMGAIGIGTRWEGLNQNAESGAIAALADFSQMPVLAERLTQAMANFNTLVPFVEDSLALDPLLAASDDSGSLIDPNRRYYYGISQGGIFGTTFLALSPHIQSGVLHVPTSMYASVLQHTPLFADFQLVIDDQFPDYIDGQLILAYYQRLFDPLEPANFVRHIHGDPLTDLGDKNALWQVNWGDKSAPEINAYALARSADMPLLAPSAHPIELMDTLDMPTGPDSSGLIIFDPQLGQLPYRNDMPVAPGAHNATRRNPEVLGQIQAFFSPDDPSQEGTIVNLCGGPCVIDPVPDPSE